MFIAIVPAYNEKAHIGSVIRSLFGHVDEVVVVDDGSFDNTASIARKAGATVLRHEINRGQGASLETGHAYARKHGADYIIHFDADGQFDVGDILPALNKIKHAQADVLFGSRFLQKPSNIPWVKRCVLFPLARRVDAMFGSAQLSDVHNGFRILNKKAVNTIRITQDRMAHATEIPKQVAQHNLTYIEHPITVHYHEFGQGMFGGLKIIKELLIGRFINK